MSREQGFPIADVDSSLFDDPKVRRLVRQVGEARAASAMLTYIATVLASWASGERQTAEDATPIWRRVDADDVQALQDVELLDDDGRIPEHAWEGWFGPARDRREERREAGRRGGLAKARNAASGPPPSSATAEVQLGSTRPFLPTVPTVPTVLPRATHGAALGESAPHADDGRSFKERVRLDRQTGTYTAAGSSE